jgi:uncharacterized protein YndB with AHSA1/START domain
MSHEPHDVPPVIRSVTVRVPIERAFELFSEQPLDWWPAHHKLVPGERVSMVFEPAVGGRWQEADADGAVADWGRVLEWDPPRRIALTWRIDGRWQPIADDAKASEIEVEFTADGPDRTLVRLGHVKLGKLGAYAESVRAGLDVPGPGATLGRYEELVERTLAEAAV